jgi:hypothetical protein
LKVHGAISRNSLTASQMRRSVRPVWSNSLSPRKSRIFTGATSNLHGLAVSLNQPARAIYAERSERNNILGSYFVVRHRLHFESPTISDNNHAKRDGLGRPNKGSFR